MTTPPAPTDAETDARRERRAYAWMALASALFATMNLLARLATGHASWSLVAAVRALVGLGVAVAVARVRGRSLRVADRRAMWLRSILGTTAMGCTFLALSRPSLPLGDVVTLLNLGPLFLAALSPLVLGERSGRRVWIAVPLAMTGVVLVLRPAAIFGGAVPREGALLTAAIALGGALSTALAMMALRRLGPKESTEAIAIHFSATATVVFAAFAAFDHGAPRLADLGPMLGAGVCAGFGQLAMTRAYTLGRAARVAAVGYVAVVVSAVYGAIALAELPRGTAWLGMGLVIAGGLTVALPRAR